MITISTACSFAAYSSEEKILQSAIVTIGEGATIICNQDEKKDSNGKIMKGDVVFFSNRAALVSHLKSKNIKNADNTEITEEEI
jgi:hypothetical protein